MQSRASILISRPTENVFAFITEPANDKRWRSHLTASRGHITAVGDRVTQTYSYQGKTHSAELEIVEFQPPERLTYAITEPARARVTLTCRPDGSGTRVSMQMTANVSGPAALFAGRIQSEMEKLARTDLESLKRALESVE
ncbi:MAG: SRPBCC family protein [Coriobacteriia bacterium]|nr:SRPBCC family protein [Coriobacteriia bacterium]